MARIVRNQRLDSRSARALLPMRHAPYWHALTRGRALGYRKGSKGGTWIAKYRTADGKREQLLLGAADDAFDGETSDVLSFAAAQAKARDWFEALDRDAGRRRPRYTVEDALDDYIENFTGKSLDKTRYVIDRLVRPEFRNVQVSDLTTERLREFMEKLAARRSAIARTRRASRKSVRFAMMQRACSVRTPTGRSPRFALRSIARSRWARWPTTAHGVGSSPIRRSARPASDTSPVPKSIVWSSVRQSGSGPLCRQRCLPGRVGPRSIGCVCATST